MKIDLSGKTALVTGSTTGIGHAIARGLVAAGADVTVNGRTQAKVDSAIAAIAEAVPGAKVRHPPPTARHSAPRAASFRPSREARSPAENARSLDAGSVHVTRHSSSPAKAGDPVFQRRLRV